MVAGAPRISYRHHCRNSFRLVCIQHRPPQSFGNRSRFPKPTHYPAWFGKHRTFYASLHRLPSLRKRLPDKGDYTIIFRIWPLRNITAANEL